MTLAVRAYPPIIAMNEVVTICESVNDILDIADGIPMCKMRFTYDKNAPKLSGLAKDMPFFLKINITYAKEMTVAAPQPSAIMFAAPVGVAPVRFTARILSIRLSRLLN
jgi:hypothetical protein